MESTQELPGIAGKIKNIDGKNCCPLINKNNEKKEEGSLSKVNSEVTKEDSPFDSKEESVPPPLVKTDTPWAMPRTSMGGGSYAETLKNATQPRKLNFRFLESNVNQPGVDVVLPKESVRAVQKKLEFTLFGYFMGERIAYPVVEYFAKSNWKKFGLQKSMMNSNGFFFFKFDSEKGMLDVLEGGPWLIRSKPIFLNVWSASAKLKKEDIQTLAVWVKFHDVPQAAYTEEGLSMLASKIGKPKLLDSYTTSMCLDAWGRSSYARALIEISALHELKTEVTIAIPHLESDQYANETVYVEYEWSPPRCAHCSVFGHDSKDCPKQLKPKQKEQVVADDEGYIKAKGKKVAKRVGFPVNKQPPKFEYRPVVLKKNGNASSSNGNASSSNKSSTPSKGFTKNSFADLSFLNDDDSLSDDEEVIEIEELNDTQKFMASGMNSSSKGASTPFSKGLYGKL